MPRAQGSLSQLFFVHYLGRRSHFSKGHLPFAAKCTKSELLDFSGSDFIFLTIKISHISPLPLLHCIASSINAWRRVVQKYVILIKITPVLYFFCPFSVYFRFSGRFCKRFFLGGMLLRMTMRRRIILRHQYIGLSLSS